MSEETESAESGGEGIGGADPFAAAMALGSASKEKADDFLEVQTALAKDQRHHLHEQLKGLRLKLWEMRLGVLLRIATAFVGLAVAAGLGFLIWNASQSSDLVMDSFSVPPDLVEKGMSGEAMAGDIAGRIADMNARYTSPRAPQSYGNNFGDGLKIEIPETGVSLAELDRFLRAKLGNDTHISGEVMHTPKGLKLSVRAGALGGASVEGPDSDLDSLQQQLAEKLFGLTQPYRYGNYLSSEDRTDESNAVYQKLTSSASARERAWGFYGLAVNVAGWRPTVDFEARALENDPTNAAATTNLAGAENSLGHTEQGLIFQRKVLELLARADHGQYRADGVTAFRLGTEATIANTLGAYRDAEQKLLDPERFGRLGQNDYRALAAYQRQEHDLAAAHASMAAVQGRGPGLALFDARNNEIERMREAMAAEDWNTALISLPVLQDILAKMPGAREDYHLTTDRDVAYIYARLVRFDDAEKLIADFPGDCAPCHIARAQIAALQRQDGRADYWFAMAVKAAPSIPRGYFEWGKALKERGDLTGAIAKFKLANQKGPHFADPLEMWGEVLIAQNRSDLAIAKFTEAEKYAPNWGRLHLKWGEALRYVGKIDEAQKQFTRAGELDLTAAEKTELKKVAP